MPVLPKKLIEVALPLDDINIAAAREKAIRHGHPSTLHLWWARRPLAAARAVLFAQLVNDPGWREEHDAAAQGLSGNPEAVRSRRRRAEKKRDELFDLIRELVLWENTTNEDVLERARRAIRESWAETCRLNPGDPDFDPARMPPMHDPFAGGGAIPLEAQRLGLNARASDLNPVAVLINKAMIEIPPRFAGRIPVGPLPDGERQTAFGAQWPGASGLAEDVRRYGAWMRAEAKRRIGHLYPPARLPASHGGGEATVIAWLWARTVASPNPAAGGAHVPLVSSFWLSTKPGKETYVEPVVDGTTYRFEVRTGKEGPSIEETVNRKGGVCLLTGSPMPFSYIRAEGKAGRMGVRLMAIVAEGNRRRIYLPASEEHERLAATPDPTWAPEINLPDNPRDFKTPNYGLTTFADLFTKRQLVALTTFSDLVTEGREKVAADAHRHAFPEDDRPLADGGTGAAAYGEAVGLFLGLVSSKMAMFMSSGSRWRPGADKTAPAFGRQAIPMVWDFAEINPFAGAGGDFSGVIDGAVKVIASLWPHGESKAWQQDIQVIDLQTSIFSTDPPYYDNIVYADLSDFSTFGCAELCGASIRLCLRPCSCRRWKNSSPRRTAMGGWAMPSASS